MFFVSGLRGADYYVGPNGSPKGDGSREKPWDLATALSGKLIAPGSTVWVMGGTYRGAFTSYLHGTSDAPISMRVIPGQRAILDGHGFRGERQNSVFAVFGEWTNYIGLEITSSETERENPPNNGFRQSGFDVFGPHVKLINLLVHDTGEGNGMWVEAVDSELYGSIIFNCGSRNKPTDIRHGHALYTQNMDGTKRIVDNLMFNEFGFGIHGWGIPHGIRGFDVEGNIIFNSGAPSGEGMRLANILITGGSKIIADRISIIDNYTYQTPRYTPVHDVLHDSNTCLVCDNNSVHGSATIQGNYFAGGAPVMVTGKWSNLTLSRNTFVGINGMVATAELRNGSSWDHNEYFGQGAGGEKAVFGYNGKAFAFAQWKSLTGADRGSTYSEAMPKNAVFVRPNHYEQGRGYVAIYNWEHASAVQVDISSVVSPGSQYEIRNAQDFFGAPVASGTYHGGTVSVPMTNLRLEPPLGLGYAPPSTFPEFNAFVVLAAGKYPVQDVPSTVVSEQTPPRQSEAGLGPAQQSADGAKSPASGLERYVGTYVSANPKAQVVVSLEGDHLVAKMLHEQGQPSYRLSRSTGERFNLAGAPATVYLEFESHADLPASMQFHRSPLPTVRLTRTQ